MKRIRYLSTIDASRKALLEPRLNGDDRELSLQIWLATQATCGFDLYVLRGLN